MQKEDLLESKFHNEKTCPNCHKKFGCGAGTGNGCWCTAFPPIMPLDDIIGCYCPNCLKDIIKEKIDQFVVEFDPKDPLPEKYNLDNHPQLLEDIDYYINEDDNWVFTSWYLIRRGYCCGNGCKHCPYEMKS